VFAHVSADTLVLLCAVAVELNDVTADHVPPPSTDVEYAYVVIGEPPVLTGIAQDNDV
jgi:hypothetical protein